MKKEIRPADGKLMVFIPGMGAITSTFLTGVKKGLSTPIGSLALMGHIRLGKRTENRSPMVKDFVSLATLDDLEFAGWDIFEENMYDAVAAVEAGVVKREDVENVNGAPNFSVDIGAIQELAEKKKVPTAGNDTLLFIDLAHRSGFYCIQEWMSFYFKSPHVPEGLYPEHDIFIQQTKFKNTLRHMQGEELISHLGSEYYEYMDES